jgi:hypothetical protein
MLKSVESVENFVETHFYVDRLCSLFNNFCGKAVESHFTKGKIVFFLVPSSSCTNLDVFYTIFNDLLEIWVFFNA